MKHKKLKTALILLLLCVIIAVVPLLTLHADFGGADSAAENTVSEVDPGYKPWAKNLVTLPGSETESLLFCLQAALGSGVLCFGFGWLAAKKKYGGDAASKSGPT